MLYSVLVVFLQLFTKKLLGQTPPQSPSFVPCYNHAVLRRKKPTGSPWFASTLSPTLLVAGARGSRGRLGRQHKSGTTLGQL